MISWVRLPYCGATGHVADVGSGSWPRDNAQERVSASLDGPGAPRSGLLEEIFPLSVKETAAERPMPRRL